MSGPKVVRIVTREEVLAICNGLLAQLDAALGRWGRDVALIGGLPASEIERFRARRDRIRALLEADRLLEIQKAVPSEIGYLATDLEDRRDRATSERARRRAGEHRVRATAKSLLGALSHRRGTLGPLIEKLRALSRGEGMEGAAPALHEAFGLLSDSGGDGGLSEVQRQLAAALRDGDRTITISEWIAARTNADRDRDDRIAEQITRFETEFGEAAGAAFQIRWDEISTERDPSRRRMMTDTLSLDIARAEREGREMEARRTELANLDADLAAHAGEDTEAARAAIARGLASERTAEMDAAIDLGRRALEDAHLALSSEAQRRALTTQLGKFGYEVREGMETALVENGRIVVRTPHSEDYGIEVMSAKSRFQLRAVRLAALQTRPAMLS